MLTGTATRRSAVVLAMALIAMFLVVLAGSARVAQNRTGAAPGHASPAPQQGRQAAAVAPAPPDQSVWHLDLASTPPIGFTATSAVGSEHFTADAVSILTIDAITATGRAPPAL